MTQGKRDYSACALTGRTAAQITANPPAPTIAAASATAANASIILFDLGGVPANFTSTFFQVGPNRTLIPGFTPYNFAPSNYFQRPDERYTAGLFAEYEISQALQPYMEFMFMDDRTVAQIAPSGTSATRSASTATTLCASAQQRSIICDTENLLSSPGRHRRRAPGDPPFLFTDPITGATFTAGLPRSSGATSKAAGVGTTGSTLLSRRRRHARRSQRRLVL